MRQSWRYDSRMKGGRYSRFAPSIGRGLNEYNKRNIIETCLGIYNILNIDMYVYCIHNIHM